MNEPILDKLSLNTTLSKALEKSNQFLENHMGFFTITWPSDLTEKSGKIVRRS